jgi:hypothetical protein
MARSQNKLIDKFARNAIKLRILQTDAICDMYIVIKLDKKTNKVLVMSAAIQRTAI